MNTQNSSSDLVRGMDKNESTTLFCVYVVLSPVLEFYPKAQPPKTVCSFLINACIKVDDASLKIYPLQLVQSRGLETSSADDKAKATNAQGETVLEVKMVSH